MTTATATRPRLGWRVVDMVTAAILGVACGLVFLVWNQIGGLGYSLFEAVTPGIGGLVTGIWLIGGTIGGLIIRKPGAALFVEVLAASVSAALGSQWGIPTIYSGIAQGLGVEIVLALFLYRRFDLLVASLSGAGAGLGAWILELFTSGNLEKGAVFNVTYLVCLMISGAVLAGMLAHALVKGLAKAGALDRFAAGREVRERV
ncbi:MULTISPECIES: ECF transporter S component [Schaalia]|uniref:ECF transporter S component n=1 Tax=Schaalia TaxID=2529408 RepID=UPI001F28E974|nr:ECF transporter S component [Schaalia hyovaginalis]MCF2711612.1 ECF transporter S component [Schaalia hyovaginalis]MCI6556339.1 ECF transporter S component [Schaalia hyovaginalis]MDD7553182.1 ECF transporter S component [Schaalia hyovaginalis]MDY3094324.1 ECF transporter S component [Schaalia hyovaginalis]MDY4492243.1 ECF transporter S component [Schaalia hyovaginalis]